MLQKAGIATVSRGRSLKCCRLACSNNLSAVTLKHSEQTIISSACSELLSPVTTGRLGPSPLVFTDIWHPGSSWLSCPVCFDYKHATEGMSRGMKKKTKKNMTTNTPTSCGAVCDDASAALDQNTLGGPFFSCARRAEPGWFFKLLTCC